MTVAVKTQADSSSLPVWDLSDLYPSMEAPELTRDLDEVERGADEFARNYGGSVEALDGDALARAIEEYERLGETLGRLVSYAQLVHAEDMTDPQRGTFYQNVMEHVTDVSATLLFFTLALNKIEDAAMQSLLDSSAALNRYAPWIRDVRAGRPYQLSDELEKLLHEKSVAGSSAWNRLFDETLARLRVPFDGEEMPVEEVLDKLSDKDGETRKKAAKALGATFEAQAPLFSLVTNTLAKDKEIEDRWRGFKRPISSRNLANYVEDDVVDALVSSVKAAYPKLSHRYYAQKAKWLGKEKLEYWDRNAPLQADDRRWGWQESVDIVLDAYGAFDPRMRELGQRFFDHNWIDVPLRAGKAPGAFAHPTVPSAHPYLLLNFQGKTRDVMTLAHELGHGVHQVLSAEQGALMSDTPLTLAETASVFGEMLTFREILRRETDETNRKWIIAAKIEDMLNTVVRQIAFCEFERKVHDARRHGELPAEAIGEIWMEVQGESLGPAIHFDDEYRHYWMYIPHFIHSPFYVYAYAFGDCLVNSLYACYEQSKGQFEDKYFDLLRAGGTLRHKELLALFGLNAGDPAFWQQGLDIIAGLIDEVAD